MPLKKAHPEAGDPHGYAAAAETGIGNGAAADDSDLAECESRWNHALVGSGLGVWDHNYRLDTKYYSPTWKTIRGMAPDEEADGDYEAWLQLVHPDDRDFVVHAIDRQNAGDPNYQIFEYRERHKDGHWVWIECRGACVEWDENGVPTRIIGTDTDITARKQAEETLSRLSRRLDLALEVSRIGVFEADIERDTVEWDDRLIAIYGLQGASRQIASDAWAKSLHPDDRERVLGLSDRSVESGRDFQQEYRIIRGDGVERVIRARSAFFIDGNGHRKLIGANWDVTEEVALRNELQRAKDLAEARNRELEAAKESIEHLALHDYLTGLPNRRYLDKMLGERSTECRAKGLALAILHIDLDRFKQINDTLGHRAGDAMLQHAASVLRNSVRAADFVARIGGDEFVILCAVDPASKKIGGLAERLIRELRKPVRYEGHDCRFGASVGIAIDSGPKLDAKQILLDADIALYRAKGLGRNRFEFFSASARRDIISAKHLADEILIGLERSEFVPFYQLQFDARTLDVTGVETLARWQHPVHGLLTPDRFLDIAEDLDVVSTIDALILERAIADRKAWLKDGLPIPKISVNVSARRLADPDLGKKLRALKIEPGTFSFELLESISLDDCDEAVAANLKKLRKLGIDIQIDDFGTGHASIVSLLRLSPKTLKIDRELIRMLPQSAEQRKLVGSIIDIGRSLDILVIAEGVETADHIRILEELDCDTLQGYALARPMPAMQIPSFIRAGSWRHGQTAARALQTQLRRALPGRAAK
ncbi:EAL domain-containing protein [Rhizobium leguminosarum]|uniref:bifunctional diguanylate cyclase/phosphodiesterase n=1 Tax=Rhizobium TaxID=379 RepID=UPI0014783A3C|nr:MULTISPECIES: EAL domain-containing protein [Rhizobium]MBY5353418.1 EAL domain-containing protein [Rhizobium leguminosarum]NNH41545.1 EAL domain-containing protein [Rhizobium laguerreae]